MGCLTLGATEDHVLDQGQFGLYCMPDEHMTYMRQSDGSSRFWIAAGTTPPGGGPAIPGAVGLTTDDFENFTPLTLFEGNAVAGLVPSGPGTENFDADYVGPGAVIPALNGTDLLMFYHAENHLFNGVHYDFSPFYSSIGLARSTDDGMTWSRVGQVITGITPKPTEPPPGALGAGGPSVIVSGGYLYLFYLDVGNYDVYPDVIHVARAPVASDGAPGSWLKYYRGAFSEPGLGGLSTPVQGQVPPDEITKGAFWPDVSYNTCLQKYLMVFQTSDGYYYSTSPDLVTWTLQSKIFSFAPEFDPNGVWYGYQALMSPDQQSERVTSCSGYLYYAKRSNYSTVCQSMYRRPFSFSSMAATLKSRPKSLRFGTVIELDGVGATSAPRFEILVNPKNRKQDAPVTITGIAVTGDFTKSGSTTCETTLAPGASCTVGVTFSPTGVGRRTGTLTITTNAAGSPTILVPLSGKGRQGKLRYAPKSINYGKESVGSQTGPKTVNVANRNPVPMSLGISSSGPFTIVSNSCPPALAPNGTCAVGVAFAPIITGRVQGALTFADPAVGSPQSVKLVGRGD